MLQDLFQVTNHMVLFPGPQIIVGVMKLPHVKGSDLRAHLFFQNWLMRIHCLYCCWSSPCHFTSPWEQRPKTLVETWLYNLPECPCPALSLQTHQVLGPHYDLWHWGVFVYLSWIESGMFLSFFRIQDLFCLSSLLSHSSQLSLPKADHTPSFSRTHSLSIFQYKAAKSF